jgi:hypothetical protein
MKEAWINALGSIAFFSLGVGHARSNSRKKPNEHARSISVLG